ncbi:MAG: SLBB domain-containing protein [Candidatus Margulisbacteria bacterium]|nr:SLBB domain-containing protein [Candidatus Margulisiibacteriota bacterium]MBU1617143.1 SLBB domain-containing protein [Candidatus Margulisiibacteriota bacterium]
MERIVSFILIMCLASTAFPAFALSVEEFSLNTPNIQSVGAIEQAGPKSAGDMVLELPIDGAAYILGPGDLLAIHIIIGDGELSVDHNLLVGADGKIYFPNIGEIYISGVSLDQAKNKINNEIKSRYRNNYQLSVLLSQPKKVKIYLSGMVKNPGPLSVYDNLRVSEVIAQSGGVASGASNRFIYIRRKATNGKEILFAADLFEAYRSRDLSKDLRVQAGDIIEVPDSDNLLLSQTQEKENDKLLFEGKETFVYVYGEVNKSGRFEYVPGKRLSDYISYAGGPTARALLSGTTVSRGENGQARKINIDVADAIYNGKKEKDIELIGGDVVNVPGNFFYFSDFSSFASMIFTGVALYNTFKR